MTERPHQSTARRGRDIHAPIWRILVGVGIPFVAVDLALPVLDHVGGTVLGFPTVVFWLFAWFILTSVCLSAVWFLHDRRRTDEAG
ncbi:DUF3311 domain-containing protein [Gluconacetobacter azotocaptans]|uniref:DUF3311 domain-containing protein n=1 Tax=Gluconacetobacter azotocaptans TaxID=142834 RepID=UPI00195D1AC3|nr:DUF3311 domain-containing protein [Gluconacetobacter azotocaptans]MBM9400281.1 DUF3311 domain-containing protein [Gluconacetobacter azotocaptans]